MTEPNKRLEEAKKLPTPVLYSSKPRAGDREDCQEPEIEEGAVGAVFLNSDDVRLPGKARMLRPLPSSLSLNCLRKNGMC